MTLQKYRFFEGSAFWRIAEPKRLFFSKIASRGKRHSLFD
jgi:hypothetical protein